MVFSSIFETENVDKSRGNGCDNIVRQFKVKITHLAFYTKDTDEMRLRNIPEAKGIVAASPHVLHFAQSGGAAAGEALSAGANTAAADGGTKTGAADGTVETGERHAGVREAIGTETGERPARVREAIGTEMPIHMEIGMGKGAFLIEMARRHPENFYIGVERYETVLLRAVQKMDELTEEEEEPQNLKFLCEDAANLPSLFPEGSVDRLYLNFSDPWPKARHEKRRLTSHYFLSIYEKFLAPGGLLVFKTDNRGLFDFSVESVGSAPHWKLLDVTYDLHHTLAPGEENVMTEYEKKFSNLGSKICRLTAQYTNHPECERTDCEVRE